MSKKKTLLMKAMRTSKSIIIHEMDNSFLNWKELRTQRKLNSTFKVHTDMGMIFICSYRVDIRYSKVSIREPVNLMVIFIIFRFTDALELF
ncbi:hypothetical protein BpHYR1_024799, partial [Brachionus plicatilis]